MRRKVEERRDSGRKGLPDLVVSVSFFLFAWKERVCFHKVNGRETNPINSSDVGTGA